MTRALTPQTISYFVPNTNTVSSDSRTITARSSQGLPVTITRADASSEFCTVNGTPGAYSLTALAAGSCVLTFSQAGDATRAPATLTLTRTITVALTPQTISYFIPSTLTVSGTPRTITGTSSQGLEVTITRADASSAFCTVNGTPGAYSLTALAAGSCVLTFSQAGDATLSLIHI